MRYWIPPIIWGAIVLIASGDTFSAVHTGVILQAIVTAIRGRPLTPEQFEMAHFLIRKAAHLTEYGILGALWFRALRGTERGFRWQWAVGAIALAAGIACIDELHQSFIPSRTGSPVDVMIDVVGASIAQIAIRLGIRS